MAEHIFVLDQLNPLEVFGVNNSRIHQIEDAYPDIRIVARGDELKIQGEDLRVALLTDILEALLNELRRKGALSDQRFLELLTPPPGDADTPFAEGYGHVSDDEVLVHGNSGIIVKPKTHGQRQIVAAARHHDVVFAVGPAGTGKTYTAVALAVKALKEKKVKKIILCRPAVEAGENLGFLPGDLKEKIDPYLRPLYDALDDMIHAEKLKMYLQQNTIEIAPLAFMRGRTLNKAFIILDEAQNASELQLKMFLTRLGEFSQMIITGDDTQIDLPPKQRSGLVQSAHILRDVKGIAFVRLNASDVVRHRLVRDILAAYERAK